MAHALAYLRKLLHLQVVTLFHGHRTTAACPAARRCERIWRLGGRGQRASVDVNDSDKDSRSSNKSNNNKNYNYNNNNNNNNNKV